MNAAKPVHVADTAPVALEPSFPTEIAAEWVEPAPAPRRLPLALWGVFPHLPAVARFEPVLEDRKPLKGRGAGQRAWR